MRESALQAPQNLAKAVLLMVTNNIGSIARLHAQAAGVRHIMFTGSFLYENTVLCAPNFQDSREERNMTLWTASFQLLHINSVVSNRVWLRRPL